MTYKNHLCRLLAECRGRTVRISHASSKILLLLAGLAISMPNAIAQLQSGTVVVVGYSKQKVIVAADSRQSSPVGRHRDSGCKIAALNDKLIFSVAGTASHEKNGVVDWDAFAEARSALAANQRFDGESIDHFMSRAITDWGTRISNDLQQTPSSVDELLPRLDHAVVYGVFATLDDKGYPHAYELAMYPKMQDGVLRIIGQLTNIPISDATTFMVLSEDDIYKEFNDGKTERSKEWRAQVPSYTKRLKTNDTDLAKAILLVDLTGTYGNEKVPNAPNEQLVGGPTDAVELTSGGSVMWAQRKLNCPER